MANELSYETFARILNTTFRIHVGESQTIDAVLAEISEHMISARQERFSIVFRAPTQPLLPQGLRHFEHDEIGSFDLFIVPIGRDEHSVQYEAVFNRLRPSAPK
jgi:hypothetical protein